MRVVILWREKTDYARTVRDWLRDIEHQTGRVPESVDPDTREGVSLAKVYDVVEYPTILALDNDGRLLQMWRGAMMPRIDDVLYYMMQR